MKWILHEDFVLWISDRKQKRLEHVNVEINARPTQVIKKPHRFYSDTIRT